MSSSQPFMTRAALYCTLASAVSVLVSIAVSQIFLALAFATLLMSGQKMRLPRVWIPIAAFMGLTVLSMLMSGAPGEGRPQIRKFFVFLTLVVAFSTLNVVWARRLVLAWAIVGGLSSAVAIAQFIRSAQRLGVSTYEFYINERITGFMGHWMTFGGEQMIVFLMLAAFLLFSGKARGAWLWAGIACAAVLSTALLLGMTRSVWLGTAGAALYLLWIWKRKLVLALPIVIVVALLVGPPAVRTRFQSIFEPRKETDSNQHRIVCWRIGWEMIKAHPVFGVGPEIVKRDYEKYVPADIPRPLPTGWYGHLHSIYVHYAAERGIPALIVLLWMFAMLFRDFRRAVRRAPAASDERALLHGCLAGLIAVMISGIFELNLGDSEVLAMFLAMIACGYLAVESTRLRADAVPVEPHHLAADA